MNTYTQLLTSVDGRSIPVYVAEPDAALRGAIVVVQEIFGVNSHIRSVADRYAASGLGTDRAARIAPLGGLVKRSVPVGLHSDFPMAPAEPLLPAPASPAACMCW